MNSPSERYTPTWRTPRRRKKTRSPARSSSRPISMPSYRWLAVVRGGLRPSCRGRTAGRTPSSRCHDAWCHPSGRECQSSAGRQYEATRRGARSERPRLQRPTSGSRPGQNQPSVCRDRTMSGGRGASERQGGRTSGVRDVVGRRSPRRQNLTLWRRSRTSWTSGRSRWGCSSWLQGLREESLRCGGSMP